MIALLTNYNPGIKRVQALTDITYEKKFSVSALLKYGIVYRPVLLISNHYRRLEIH